MYEARLEKSGGAYGRKPVAVAWKSGAKGRKYISIRLDEGAEWPDHVLLVRG